MIKVENIRVFNLEGAIRGMRNPMNSWHLSDSVDCNYKETGECSVPCNGLKCVEPVRCNTGEYYCIGEKDLALMKKLYKGGPVHRKYARQIFVSMDITCHHIFWAEFDTYKVGTTRNSCSKMHKIHVKTFTKDDFSHEGIDAVGGGVKEIFETVIWKLNILRTKFNETQDRKYWRAMLELLPMGYNIKATVTMTYENVFNILDWRSDHKIFEWIELCNILRDLPYVEDIIND